MGFAEVGIAASAENSVVVAGLAEMPEAAALPTETLSQPEATEALAEC